MQPKLFQLLGLVETKGDVGLEIEVEGDGLVEVRDAIWRSEPDGSLRGHYPDTACEYILKKPIPIDKVEAAVRGLNKHLAESKPNFSFRTSVHVHVNVQQLDIDQIMNMIYTYLLIEEPLINFCGKVRKGNQFALRLVDAEGLIGGLANIFTNGRIAFEGDHYRYASLNIEALTKYGSLEFRGMRGTLDNKVITAWANTLINIREYAKAMESPMDVYEDYVKLGPRGFFDKVVGKYAEVYEYPRLTQEIQRNFSLTLDLPHMFRKQWEDRKKPKPKEMDYQGIRKGDIVTQKQAIDLINLKIGFEGHMFKGMGGMKYEVIAIPKRAKPAIEAFLDQPQFIVAAPLPIDEVDW